MKRNPLILLIFAIFLFPQIIFAQQLQWQKTTGVFSGPLSVIYFTNEFNGFTSVGTAPGGPSLTPQLSRTTDGGATWKEVNVDQLSGGLYGIQDIIMTDSLNGWACGQGSNGYSVWHTTDGGWNWRTAGTNDNRYSVCIRVTGAGIVISDFYHHNVRISKDNGITFNDVFASPSSDDLLGMDFSDPMHGVLVASFRSGSPWYYTTDGGSSWNSSNLNMESWSVYAQKGTSNFYATPEMWSTGSGGPTTVYHSTDNGMTWNVVSQLSFNMTGAITGTGSVLYAQAQYWNSPGIYHSTDGGTSWKLLGGPGGFGDTRFIAVPSACRKSVIYAAGLDHTVYKAYDDGVDVGTLNQNTGVYMQYQPAARILSGDTADVQVTVKFPLNSKAIGFIPDEVEYSVKFDPAVIELSHISDIIPPTGWTRKSVAGTIGGDNIDITLTNTNKVPLAAVQNFGSIGFYALPPSSHHGTSVILSTLKLRTECNSISGIPDIESGVLRAITVITNSVNDEAKVLRHGLQIFPNPAKQEIRIFCADGIFAKSFKLIDITGRIMKTLFQSELNDANISVADFPSGIYALVAEYSDGTESLKFSIVK